ncbi:hypothetical protein EJ110_NYTH02304 [Nymphaea thermarum]|nr:hypothetical protein EJ110_NYTH02304 [Nymphaea thermarum]
MASRHAIGPASAPFPLTGRWSVRTTEKAEARFALFSRQLSRRVPTLRGVNGLSLFCRAAVASPGEETIRRGEKNGDPVAELGRSLSFARAAAVEVEREEDAAGSHRPIVSAESIGRWMRESVPEISDQPPRLPLQIVRSIEEAPFIVCLYCKKKGQGVKLTREMVAAEEQSWRRTRQLVEEKCPDGIILVKELKEINQKKQEARSRCSKSWGLLVQGRGSSPCLCYVLETSSVCSAIGLCTHYCLIKAKCYGDPVEAQVRDSWLGSW